MRHSGMNPSVVSLNGDGLQQLSYQLPHRIHTAKGYPLKAPNGPYITVYGHENGIRVIWRGGSESKEREYQNEHSHASVTSTLDIALGGSEALSIAFPQLPPDVYHHTKSLPGIVSRRLVAAVACSDCNIRVVILPLTPPSASGKQSLSDTAAEQVITLSGSPSHQSLSNCVSMTYTSRWPPEDRDLNMDGGEEITKELEYPSNASRPESRRSSGSHAQDERSWDLLVASHSLDLSGRLLIHRIPINGTALDDSAESTIPITAQGLPSQAVSVCFSSALYPSPHHSRLLIAEAKGVVRIMDGIPKAGSSRGGPWLASLFTEFAPPSDGTLPKRKGILDARWLLEGKAVIVLLTNSEWGVWNIENVGPRSAEATIQARQSTNPSQFAIDGWVGTKMSVSTGSSGTQKGSDENSTLKLAPMTPSTRKTRQALLFAGPEREQHGPSRGGISISPASSASSSRADDEFVLLWQGTNIVTIPSFCTLWQTRIRGSGSLFGVKAKDEIKTISNVQFSGERCREVSINPINVSEIIVTTEGRLIVIAPPYTEKRGAPPAPKTPDSSVSTDKQLLAAGELDILAMDRVLDKMVNGDHTLDLPIAKTKSPKSSRRA